MSALLLTCLSLLPLNSTASLDIGPIIFAPKEVCSGDDLCGEIWKPDSTIRLEIKMGSKILYSCKEHEELIFCIRIPVGETGIITLYAEDDLGNLSTHDVVIYP